jgi:hypothetical protein
VYLFIPIKIWLSYVKEAELRFGGYEYSKEWSDRGNTGYVSTSICADLGGEKASLSRDPCITLAD